MAVLFFLVFHWVVLTRAVRICNQCKDLPTISTVHLLLSLRHYCPVLLCQINYFWVELSWVEYRFDHESNNATQHRPYYGLAIYSKYPLKHMNWLTLQKDIQVFFCTLDTGYLPVQLTFLYVPPKFQSLANQKFIFDEVISSLQDISDMMTIICGDFNYDLFHEKTLKDYVLKSYHIYQVIDEVTTGYGTLLDHMYTNIPTENLLSVGALESYYSDHKPVFMSFKCWMMV